MNNEQSIDPEQLALTVRGASWIEQFDQKDRDSARVLLNALTLVSHNEFERALTNLIVDETDCVDGPVALYATREVDSTQPHFLNEGVPIDAVGGGSDLGSEARVAAIIRNISRAYPTKFLNHPTLKDMREARCRGIFLIDDFIGSGERTSEFLSSIWKNATVRSWHSLHLISIHAIAYSGTKEGSRRVERARARPKIRVERDCPTFYELPWSRRHRQRILTLIDKYGARTSYPGTAMGYGLTAAAIVFEHGCPDNCPAILWAPHTAAVLWEPMFPQRSVLPVDASAFPPEIARPDAELVLILAGQKRLVASKALSIPGPIGPAMLMTIALIAKGLRSRAAISYATGLSALECIQLLDRCVEWGLLTPTLRLTPAGSAELTYAREFTTHPNRVPSRGSDSYYPQQLRGRVAG